MNTAHLQVEAISAPVEAAGDRLHRFRVSFGERTGHCFITRGEALHLRQLTTEWVERALDNLAATHGEVWLERAVCTTPGLMLHHCDASEAWERSRLRRDGLTAPAEARWSLRSSTYQSHRQDEVTP